MGLKELMEMTAEKEKNADGAENVTIVYISNIVTEPYMSLYLKQCFAKIRRRVHCRFLRADAATVEAGENPALPENADIVVVHISYDGLICGTYPLAPDNKEEENRLFEYMKELLENIERQTTQTEVLVFSLEDIFSPYDRINGSLYEAERVVDAVNRRLWKICTEYRWNFLDSRRIFSRPGVRYAENYRNRIRWDCVYSETAVEQLAHEICRQYRIRQRISAKCIILDCDGVLWDGTVSEDGSDGIRLGNQGIGLSHKIFQSFLLELYHLGVVLAVCSQNDMDDLISVFDRNEEMVLEKRHISYFAAGWENKTKKILKISEFLDLPTDSFVFVDDNPAQIEEVKAILPEVACIPFNAWDPFSGFEEYFCLPRRADAEEVRYRQETYRTNLFRKKLREKQAENEENYRSYLEVLDTRLTIKPAQKNELERISSLSLRASRCTNGKRYTAKELEKIFENENYDIYAVYARDCFSELGLVGEMIVYEKQNLKSFCLSCRVLGRNAEFIMMEFLTGEYEMKSYDFISTGRNEEVEKLCKMHIGTGSCFHKRKETNR